MSESCASHVIPSKPELDHVPLIRRKRKLLFISTIRNSKPKPNINKLEEVDDDDAVVKEDDEKNKEVVLLPSDCSEIKEIEQLPTTEQSHVSCDANSGSVNGQGVTDIVAAGEFARDVDLSRDCGSQDGASTCVGLDDAAKMEVIDIRVHTPIEVSLPSLPSEVMVEPPSNELIGDGINSSTVSDVPVSIVREDVLRGSTYDELDHIVLKERKKMLLRRRQLEKPLVGVGSTQMVHASAGHSAKSWKVDCQCTDRESLVAQFQFDDTYGNNMEETAEVISCKTKPADYNLQNREDYVPTSSMNGMWVSTLPTSVKVKVEPVESDKGLHNANWNTLAGFSFNSLNVKSELNLPYEVNEDGVDHMQLLDRMKRLPSGNYPKFTNTGSSECIRKGVPPGDGVDPAIPKFGEPSMARGPRKRKKTVTDSVETAMEEDAPGLLRVLVNEGVSVDEIKLYGEPDDNDVIDENEESFSELESIMSKLFSSRTSFLKLSHVRATNISKPSYCLAGLFSLVEQAKYLQFHKWPAEWGWCRDLQSFIFVFERHNRIVLERPEYGFATYFFELVDSLPISWQIKRLVTAMKLSNCGRITLQENKPLVVGEDLTDGEAKVLMEYGWTPNTGLGTMLNYCDRVFHDRKSEKDTSEWKSKIGKLLIDGYNGGTIICSGIPLNVNDCQDAESQDAESLQIKIESFD